jgi:hypothetical protein
MIATLRWRLIAVPGWLVRHARHLILRLPPGHGLLPEVLSRLQALPHQPDLRLLSPGSPSSSTARQPRPQKGPQTANPAPAPGPPACPLPGILAHKIIFHDRDQPTALFADSGQIQQPVSPPATPLAYSQAATYAPFWNPTPAQPDA